MSERHLKKIEILERIAEFAEVILKIAE